MAGWILKIILFLILMRLLWRLARGIMEGYAPDVRSRGVGLVRDPVCGVFVVPSQALTAVADGQTKYFCSEKCRAEFRGR
jgi:YHS domain-containing protein